MAGSSKSQVSGEGRYEYSLPLLSHGPKKPSNKVIGSSNLSARKCWKAGSIEAVRLVCSRRALFYKGRST